MIKFDNPLDYYRKVGGSWQLHLFAMWAEPEKEEERVIKAMKRRGCYIDFLEEKGE